MKEFMRMIGKLLGAWIGEKAAGTNEARRAHF